MRSPLRGKAPADVALGVAAVAAAVGTFVLMALRLRYGVDFKDEAYYAALAYRFVLGDRPFVDEMNFLQLPSLMTYPLVKAFVSLTGGTTGIILFMRVMWLVSSAGLAAAGFAFLRTVMRWEVALIACLLPLVSAPFNIPSLSYNSMGSGLLAAGMIVGAWAAVHGRTRRWLLAAGVLHGLAVFAYPTLGVAVFAFAAALFVLYRRGAVKALVAYLGGAAAVGGVLGAILVASGVANVVRDWRFMTKLAGYGGGESKIVKLGQQAGTFFIQQPLFLVAVVVAVVLAVALKERGRWALLLPVVAMFPVHGSHIAYTLVLYAVTLYGLAGVLLAAGLKGRPLAQRLYVWGVLPAFAAGCVTAYTSSNGFMNAAIGFFPALLATSGVMALVMPSAEAKRSLGAALLPWALAIVFALAVVSLGRYQYRSVYHDSPRRYLKATVPAGPFAGLRTLPETARFEAQLRGDVAAYVKPGQLVLFFDNFPAGYLFTSARPAANTLWLSYSDNNFGPRDHPTLEWWRRTGKYPDVAFRYLYRVKYAPHHVVKEYVAPPRYRRAVERPRYEVWVRAGT
ncbi:MAG TPA: hypothetical protein VGK50_00530 [Coriobacteriia bacterium]|jgi:hypothetical protein